MKSTHSTSHSNAPGMLRVDTERRFLSKFKNRDLAPSNVSKITILGFLFIFLIPVSYSFSQPSGMRPPPGKEMRHWRGEPKCQKASELNLSLEQLKGLDIVRQTYLREIQLLRTQLFTKRMELKELFTDPAIKIESIRSKYLEMGEIQSKLEQRSVEYLINVRNLLTQEQLKIWCPEQELSPFQQMMHGLSPIGPIHPKKFPPPEE
jgi:Spy/CpxP family protein refolding chaperone